MKVLRTPEERFANLPDYPFDPHYTEIDTAEGARLRIHHIDEGPRDGPIILCLHGQPVWSYLYRKMIPVLTAAGMRVIAPDLVGYGKSDKPAAREDYSYERQVTWMGQWLEANDFKGMTIFGQDWGGLIGLRLVVNHDKRFDRVVISNTGLPYSPDVPKDVVKAVEDYRANGPTPQFLDIPRAFRNIKRGTMQEKFAVWQKYCWETETPAAGMLVSLFSEKTSLPLMLLKTTLNRLGVRSPLPTALAKAYEAPFPDASYMMGVRAMPSQVPTLPTSPSHEAQGKAWAFYEKFEKPFQCAFTADDPLTSGGDKTFLERVPGAKDQPKITIKKGGHFVQEGAPQELSQIIIDLVQRTPV